MGRMGGWPKALVTNVFHVVRIDAAQQAKPLHNAFGTLFIRQDWFIYSQKVGIWKASGIRSRFTRVVQI